MWQRGASQGLSAVGPTVNEAVEPTIDEDVAIARWAGRLNLCAPTVAALDMTKQSKAEPALRPAWKRVARSNSNISWKWFGNSRCISSSSNIELTRQQLTGSYL
jgi:hypothetical protein